MNLAVITFEPSALGALRLMLSYAAIDFICTMLNRYVFKNENRNENQKEPQRGRSHEK